MKDIIMNFISQDTPIPTNNCLFFHIPRTSGSSIREATGCWSKHHFSKLLKNKLSNWDDLWTFSIIRNPWDQAVSWWSLCTEKGIFNKPFRNWVIDNDNAWPYWGQVNLDPINQWQYISESSKIIVSYVARFENLEQEWKIISKKMGFSGCVLPKIASSRHTHYRDYYDEYTAQIIKKRNTEFLSNFSYNF